MTEKPDDTLSLTKIRARQCIAVRIRMLSRMITNIYDSAMNPFGIKLNQMSILSLVYLGGEVGYDTLCKRLKMEKSTASRNIERMRKQGWIEVVPAQDERRKLLKVTPTGEEILGKVHEAWEDAQTKTVSLLGEEGTEVLCNIANEIWKKDRAG